MRMLRALFLLLLSCLPAAAQSRQFSGSAGYNYQNSDQGHGVHANLNGWFAAAQFDFNDHFSVVTEMDSYYGRVQGASATQQNFVIGPQYTFRADEAKLRPYVYLQAGDQRSSAGNVEHAFDLQAGGGLQVNLTQRLALQLTPAEYNFAYPEAGATHSYSAKVGISWTFWKQSE
jgi:hypothetical protein